MSYCAFCGREEKENQCSCIHRNPVSKIEGAILILVLMLGPVYLISGFRQYSYIGVVGAFLSLVLLILTILDGIFKRNYLALFFGCHQKSNRSFKWRHYVFPLCSRCSGIYLGIFGSTALSFGIELPWGIYLLAGLPLLIDGSLQKFRGIPSTSTRRFITGFLFAGSLLFLYSTFHYGMLEMAKVLKEIF